MRSESIEYSVGSLGCRGELIYDETATRHGYTLAHAFIADAFAKKL